MSTTITETSDVLPANEAGNGSSPSSRRGRGNPRHGQPSPYSDSRRLTDDEILGLGSTDATDSLMLSSRVSPPQADDEGSAVVEEQGEKQIPRRPETPGRNDSNEEEALTEPPALRATLDAHPDLRRAWHDARAYRETFATPDDARAATALLADLDRMDALFFSHRPEDHAELARAVASLDPAAFASLARAMTSLANGDPRSAGFQPATFRANRDTQNRRQDAVATPDAAHSSPPPGSFVGQGFSPDIRDRAVRDTALPTRAEGASGARSEAVAQEGLPGRRLVEPGRPDEETERHPSTTSPNSAQLDFFHSANAAAVKNVLDAIESQVERLLPENVSRSARNRVVGEIYRELDATLQSNRQLAQQMRDAFRHGSLDTEHERAIVSLITGRARQALPAVAKRVLNEWTSTLVAATDDRRARQLAAERRVDIAGSGRAANDGIRPMTPRDLDYSRLSDSDILNL